MVNIVLDKPCDTRYSEIHQESWQGFSVYNTEAKPM